MPPPTFTGAASTLSRMPQTYVRSEPRYAWKGQTLLVTESPHARPVDRRRGAVALRERDRASDVLAFTFIHPELTHFGGGSGTSRDTVETNARGIPYRALDVRVPREVGIAELRVALEEIAPFVAALLGIPFAAPDRVLLPGLLAP